MKRGRIEDDCSILHSALGERQPILDLLFNRHFFVHFYKYKIVSCFVSYLRSLVPMFNQVIKRELVDPVEVHADGKSELDMVEKFNNTTMQVISWVSAM